MKIIYCLCALCLLVSCQTRPDADDIKENKELSAQMVGEWRNVYMKIEMNTYNNTDSSKSLEVNENTWEQKMKIRPIHTHFRADGTYNSEHYNLKDSMIYNPFGKWIILGDTIIMTDTFPERRPSYKYKVKMIGDIVEFTGMEDCDADGKPDDDYYGTQRKQKTE